MNEKPNPFTTATSSGLAVFLIANLALTALLGAVGGALNHLAARDERVAFGRGRRR